MAQQSITFHIQPVPGGYLITNISTGKSAKVPSQAAARRRVLKVTRDILSRRPELTVHVVSLDTAGRAVLKMGYRVAGDEIIGQKATSAGHAAARKTTSSRKASSRKASSRKASSHAAAHKAARRKTARSTVSPLPSPAAAAAAASRKPRRKAAKSSTAAAHRTRKPKSAAARKTAPARQRAGKKRAPSAWNKFAARYLKRGGTLKQAAAAWRAQKRG